MSAITLDAIRAVAQEWSDLGTAVQSQAIEVIDFFEVDGQNPNALRMFDGWLKTVERAFAGTPAGSDATELRELLAQQEAVAAREP